MSEQTVRVVIVDDHPLVREGIRQALSVPGFEVVGESGNGSDGIERAAELRPDVVIMDISLPGDSGIVTAERLRARLPDVRVLMLSVHDHPEYVLESIRAGAHGYLRKDSLPDDLRAAIRKVASGQTCFGAAEGGASVETAAPILAAAVQRLNLLTRRERDVLLGVASGKTNKEIATDLGLSVRTVESYRETLTRKLGIPSAAGLARFAIEAKLL
ncbi:MAG: response regulator transcription factor [Gemmatimonadales bacterium]|nr:response regulator transcription factor [Gemmatimonadales bacterium]